MSKYRVHYRLAEVLWTVTRPAATLAEALAAVPAEAEVLYGQRVA